MIDREKVIRAVDSCFDYWLDQHRYIHPLELEHVRQIKADALALLKEQDERYVSMVISWLREIAINNVDSNREMTFLDAVEDILDRASYGLKQYFVDKQEDR